jgi:hypothetical protein
MEHEHGAAVGTLEHPAGEPNGSSGKPPRHSRTVRFGAMGLTGLLVVAGLLVLRDTVPQRSADASPTSNVTNGVGPDLAHSQIFDIPRRYDGLPGRVRLPDPMVNGDVVTGALPPIDGPSQAGASRAVHLVMQRYCAHPDHAHLRLVDSSSGWWNVVGHVSAAGAAPIAVQVEWSSPSYIWTGSMRALVGCP